MTFGPRTEVLLKEILNRPHGETVSRATFNSKTA